MRCFFITLPFALWVLSACESPTFTVHKPLTTSRRKTLEYDAGSASAYSMGGSSAANPPIKASETSSAYRERLERQQRDSLPDAQVLYQNSDPDVFGHKTNTRIIQQSGSVMQEVFIGNQPVYPGQSIYSPNQFNGTLQPGYVPSGTTAVYDPVTGRVIPVRRR